MCAMIEWSSFTASEINGYFWDSCRICEGADYSMRWKIFPDFKALCNSLVTVIWMTFFILKI